MDEFMCGGLADSNFREAIRLWNKNKEECMIRFRIEKQEKLLICQVHFVMSKILMKISVIGIHAM